MSLPSGELSRDERLDWLRLIRSENVGPITFRRLIERFGSARAALTALPDLAKRGGRAGSIRIAPIGQAQTELAELDELGARLLALGEPAYPKPLAACEDAPPLLAVKGNAHLLARPTVAIVGSRHASINGKRMARKLAEGLGKAGYVVASGLARGIDGAAHEGSLAAGTVAVLAGGIDHIYPPEHADLFQRIAQAGALVSEMPPGTEPQASHFPRRNRIISGLALGVVVIEAAARSGSLITARYALDQGREIFAVPGWPEDPRAKGPNDLIRQGAHLVGSIDDILDILHDLVRRPLAEPSSPPPSLPGGSPSETEIERARGIIWENLASAPVTVDEIIRECQLSAPVVATVLLELELAGRLERLPGGKVSRLGPA